MPTASPRSLTGARDDKSECRPMERHWQYPAVTAAVGDLAVSTYGSGGKWDMTATESHAQGSNVPYF